MKRNVLLILVVASIVCASTIGGTFAWLISRVSVKNTFVVGDISISLNETTGTSYQLIPGAKLPKDPKIVVHSGSAACFVFVKIEKTSNFDNYVSYTIQDGWTELESGVYYRSFEATSGSVTYSVLSGDTVTVNSMLTDADMSALKASGSYPELKFVAYAVQKSGIMNVEDAWELVKNY